MDSTTLTANLYTPAQSSTSPDLELVHIPTPYACSRPPILFIHGGWHGAWCWEDYFMPHFAGLGYDTYALSFRGHGASKGKERLRFHSIRDYVEDIKAVVQQLPSEPIIVAHSMGAFTLMHYLRDELPRAAILLAPMPPIGVRNLTLRTLIGYPFRLLYCHLTGSLRHLVNRPELVRDLFFVNDIPAEKLQHIFSRIGDESFRAYIDCLFWALPQPVDVSGIPRLVLRAELDRIITPTEIELTGRFMQTQPKLIRGLAHDMMLDENWRLAADYISNFLAVNKL